MLHDLSFYFSFQLSYTIEHLFLPGCFQQCEYKAKIEVMKQSYFDAIKEQKDTITVDCYKSQATCSCNAILAARNDADDDDDNVGDGTIMEAANGTVATTEIVEKTPTNEVGKEVLEASSTPSSASQKRKIVVLADEVVFPYFEPFAELEVASLQKPGTVPANDVRAFVNSWTQVHQEINRSAEDSQMEKCRIIDEALTDELLPPEFRGQQGKIRLYQSTVHGSWLTPDNEENVLRWFGVQNLSQLFEDSQRKPQPEDEYVQKQPVQSENVRLKTVQSKNVRSQPVRVCKKPTLLKD
jgi:hypothetical protein